MSIEIRYIIANNLIIVYNMLAIFIQEINYGKKIN